MTTKIQLHLIKFFFQGFLPPETKEPSSSYYEVLEITRNATTDEIRRAYRKKSLQYHPDKVAQRKRREQRERENGNLNPSSAQNDESIFVQIKDAYETLSDPTRRSAYDVLGAEGGRMYCSIVVGGMQSQSEGIDVNSLVYNLARASLVDKSKLFLLVLFVVLIILLGPVLICVKIDSSWDTDWVLVLTPVWIVNILALIHHVLMKNWFALARVECLFILEILLAMKWDDLYLGSMKYDFLLVPLYVHQAVILLEGIVVIWSSRRDIQRMVTISYLERNILPHIRSQNENTNSNDINDTPSPASRVSYEDLTDDERKTIDKLYIIVTEPGSDDPNNPFDDEQENGGSLNSAEENLKFMYTVANSPEYLKMTERRTEAIRNVASVLLFRSTFLVLLVLQLQLDISDEDPSYRWNWNVVFIPLWVEILLYALYSCFLACCGRDLFQMKMGDVGQNANQGMDEMEVIEIEEVGMEGEVEVETTDNDVNIQNDIELGQESKLLLKHDEIEVADNEKIKTKVETTFSSVKQSGTAPVTQTPTNDDAGQNGNDDGNSGDGIEFDIDSQSVEKQVKAIGGCCYYILAVMALTLFLVKLNRATEVEGGVNYSSLWVMFPLFMIAALVLCLFGCCIFATPESIMKEGENGENSGGGHTNDTNGAEGVEGSTTVDEERIGPVRDARLGESYDNALLSNALEVKSNSFAFGDEPNQQEAVGMPEYSGMEDLD